MEVMVSSTSAKRLRIAFMGHLDHGKSSLIGALANALVSYGTTVETYAHCTDTFEEERVRGITIETTQINVTCDGEQFTFIDVPGHREFALNTLTGATMADAAVVVVDVTEGVRAQTDLHVRFLQLIGIRHVTFAVTKMDLVNYAKQEFDAIRADLLNLCAQLAIQPAGIVPVSVQGDNLLEPSKSMPWYAAPPLMEVASDCPRPGEDFPHVRFCIQDVYSRAGEKVSVGKLLSGSIHEGDTLTCSSCGKLARVRKLVRFPENRSPAFAGESLGLLLDKSCCNRSVLSAGEHVKTSRILNGLLVWLDEIPLSVGDTLTLRCGPLRTNATIRRIRLTGEKSDIGILRQYEFAFVRLSTDAPVAYEYFNDLRTLGRLVLENDYDTVAAGIIVES